MSKTLLLADDSVVIQKLVGLSFANEDVEIVTTDNGDDAVVMALDLKPDIVLADVVMPGKSGYEVCESIKQNSELAHIPVLLLTGTFEAFDEARASSAGADGQITKPFEAQALVERVNQVILASTAASAEPAAPAIDSPSEEFDFFDAELTSLDAGDSNPSISTDSLSADVTPAMDTIDTNDDPLFGEPGEGGIDELETENGGLALGEAVAHEAATSVGAALPQDDATIAILPEPPTPLPPSVGDPLAGFEDDLAMAEQSNTPPPIPTTEATPDPAATIVAGLASDGTATGLDEEFPQSEGIEQEFDDLTVHAPSAAIDQDASAAPSPTVIGNVQLSERGVDATVVANLDVSLAEPVREATPPPSDSALDLGPTNVSADELDFAFDVSEQVPAAELADPLGESFSSLMDISESQILAGPPADPVPPTEPAAAETVIDDSFAAGYDVSTSDLATAPTAEEIPIASTFTPEEPPEEDDSIAIGIDAADFEQADLDPALDESGADLFSDPSAALEDTVTGLEVGIPAPTSSGEERIADLSPMVEQRIQETLEKVAWEAFSDLSESIVKQVITRVEKIAWEVIPQMAETLVREEIRKMKGEKD